MALKSAQIWSKNGHETGTSLLCNNFILWHSVVDRIDHCEGFLKRNNMSSDSELSAFSESSNDDENTDVSEEEKEGIEVVYSEHTPRRVAIS